MIKLDEEDDNGKEWLTVDTLIRLLVVLFCILLLVSLCLIADSLSLLMPGDLNSMPE